MPTEVASPKEPGRLAGESGESGANRYGRAPANLIIEEAPGGAESCTVLQLRVPIPISGAKEAGTPTGGGRNIDLQKTRHQKNTQISAN